MAVEGQRPVVFLEFFHHMLLQHGSGDSKYIVLFRNMLRIKVLLDLQYMI